MDLLTDLLRHAGLQQRLLDLRPYGPDEVRRFPCARSFGFHFVLQGRLELRRQDHDAPIHLASGDIAFMARGCDHTLAAAGPAVVLGAAFRLWNDPVHPLFAELPRWRIVRREATSASPALSHLAELLQFEYRESPLGAETAIQGLIDAAFVHVLRRIIDGEACPPLSLGVAQRQPALRKALVGMHSDPARDWSLQTLADVAGLSRSAFAAKFKTTMGEGPVGYLRRLRVQRAMNLLQDTQAPLARVAHTVGYDDPFVFSKMFKKVTGQSPQQFRKAASPLSLDAAVSR